ncbi:anti-sigma-factor antagonist [[Leptolyngbya] sp. PCC 7376]|uniref:STAS domain-containing protein n=1 Tax=[Leptolyngbya] sp. PCC 7376 TaxID=111781 RepID=UPI00029F3165|nr:STAS domain-containing protein [[Leptolyngbya] sp. PCC 7376]AFY39808.1 anti-sigma-factor antagonist [[Leptolyngbya] sp. PCC 7376]
MSKKITIVEPQGVLDGLTTNELRQQIIDILQGPVDVILVDLNKITFMNSSGIGAFVAILKLVRAGEKELYLCSLTEQVQMILELTKMDRVFTIFATRDDFNAAILESSPS